MQLQKFFEVLWPQASTIGVGWFTMVFLPMPHSSVKDIDCKPLEVSKLLKPPRGLDDEIRAMGEKTGRNTYFCLAARDKKPRGSQYGGKESCIVVPGFCLDIDIFAGEVNDQVHKASNLPRSEEDALYLLQDYPLPTSVVRSGFGLQPFFGFKEPVSFDQMSRDGFEALARRFAAPAQARAAERGWQLDEVFTVNRIWRLPGFLNCKVDGDYRDTELLVDTAPRYTVEELVGTPLVPPSPSPTRGSSRPSEPVVPETEPGGGREGLSSDATVFAVADFRPDGQAHLRLREFCATLPEGDREFLLALLSPGEFAKKGSRNASRVRAASMLVYKVADFWGRWILDVPPTVLAEVFRSSAEVWASEPKAIKTLDWEMNEAVKKVAEAQRDYKQEIESTEGLRRFFSRNEPAPIHPIVQFRSSYYIWDFDKKKFTPPKTKEELDVVFVNLWRGKPAVNLTSTNAKGEVRDRPIPQLLKEYGTNADRVILDLTTQVSGFNQNEKTYYEAAAPRRPLEAKYDPEVDAWLRAFAGKEEKRFLDWLACVTKLDEPIAALLIKGSPGTGKSLLASGIGRLYEAKVLTRLNNVVGTRFNEDIARCPVIHADEGLPKGVEGLSEALRDLIAGYAQTINRKGLPSLPMKGSVRVIITTNSDRPLANMASDDFSIADLDGVAERFFHIEVAIDRTYLMGLLKKDPQILKRWIDGDALPCHILWLVENRQVVREGRFIVDGEADEVHDDLITSGTVRGLIVEWLARFLSNPLAVINRYSGQTKRVIVEKDLVVVNTQAVVDCWELVLNDRLRNKPTTSAIGNNLRVLSAGEYRPVSDDGARIRYHKIRWDLVLRWAKKHQVGDIDVMEKALEGVLPPLQVAQPEVPLSILRGRA